MKKVTFFKIHIMASHGGRRQGAGRLKREETKLVRVPLSKINTILSIRQSNYCHTIPRCLNKVAAGYPTDAADLIEEHINLQEFLVKKPEKTFAVVASGDSMINAGIKSGDLLLVDNNQQGVDGQIVIASLNGELTVKFLSLKNNRIYLLPANPLFYPIEVTEDIHFTILGVVTHTIHSL